MVLGLFGKKEKQKKRIVLLHVKDQGKLKTIKLRFTGKLLKNGFKWKEKHWRIRYRGTRDKRDYFLENLATEERVAVTPYTKRERLERCTRRISALVDKYNRAHEEGDASMEIDARYNFRKMNRIIDRLEEDTREKGFSDLGNYVSQTRDKLERVRGLIETLV